MASWADSYEQAADHREACDRYNGAPPELDWDETDGEETESGQLAIGVSGDQRGLLPPADPPQLDGGRDAGAW